MAWSKWVSRGNRSPAIAATCDVCPATASATFPRSNIPPVRLDPHRAAGFYLDAGYLTILDNVDPPTIRTTGITPDQGVVARDATPAL